MPQTQPAWFWRREGLPTELFRYSPEQVSKISAATGIDLDERDVGFLEDRVNLFLILHHNVDGAPRVAKICAALAKLQKSPNPSLLLEKLDDATLVALAAVAAIEPLPQGSPAELTVHWWYAPGSVRLRFVRRFPEPWRTAILRRWVGLALQQLPPSVRGAIPKGALRWYGDELAHFYHERTGERPTRSYSAARRRDTGRFLDFVTATLNPVNPEFLTGAYEGAPGASVIREVIDEFDPKAPWGIFRH